MKTRKTLGVVIAVATIGFTFTDVCVQAAYAQTQGMHRRDDRRGTRQESRSTKQACKASGETRSECRQTKREVKQTGRRN